MKWLTLSLFALIAAAILAAVFYYGLGWGIALFFSDGKFYSFPFGGTTALDAAKITSFVLWFLVFFAFLIYSMIKQSQPTDTHKERRSS